MNTKRASTLMDVALRAGVSKAASAAVLGSGRPTARISEATRQRIIAAAAELHYAPNAAARGLRRARLDTIGVSLQSMGRLAISNPYGNQILQGIVQTAHDSDYNVTLINKPSHDVSRTVAAFRSDLVDGAITIAPMGSEFSDLCARGMPVVAVSAHGEAIGMPAVDVDNVRGTRLLIEHLLNLGHRRIAHLTHERPQWDTEQRRTAFFDLMNEAGLPVPDGYVIAGAGDPKEYGDLSVIATTMESDINFEYYEPTCRLLSMPDRPTAIFACDDRIAWDIYRAARDKGIRVPEDLSVVGFDDIPESARMDPPLTTIRQPLLEMGAAAARMLLALLAGEEVEPKTHRFAPDLVVRNSTAAVPKDIA